MDYELLHYFGLLGNSITHMCRWLGKQLGTSARYSMLWKKLKLAFVKLMITPQTNYR